MIFSLTNTQWKEGQPLHTLGRPSFLARTCWKPTTLDYICQCVEHTVPMIICLPMPKIFEAFFFPINCKAPLEQWHTATILGVCLTLI